MKNIIKWRGEKTNVRGAETEEENTKLVYIILWRRLCELIRCETRDDVYKERLQK